MESTIAKTLRAKRIVICAGAGGVGKTTTAAALALWGAKQGRKTLVLTIDPARRLANALGLVSLEHTPQVVAADMLVEAGVAPGRLFAMMLDQKRAFDEVLERSTRDEQKRARVLGNKIYQQISSKLSGSHEYAAMAKLCDIDQDGEYDLVVVDTPPTAHALDFLDAPEKVAAAVDSPAMEWFVKPLRASGDFSLKLVGVGGSFVLRRVARFVGSEFLDDMAHFFVEASDVLGGFRDRAKDVQRLLRDPKVGFVLVTVPEPESIDEALLFHQRVVSAGLPFVGFVVNRVHNVKGTSVNDRAACRQQVVEELSRQASAASLSPYELGRAADALLDSQVEMTTLSARDQQVLGRLRHALGPARPLAEVPFFDSDVHNVSGLLRVVACFE